MINFYTWDTPNGHKIQIMLEELGVAYVTHPVDISRDEQFDEKFLKVSPNNKIPAIEDEETGTTLFESGAILMYLAEKHNKFLPKEGTQRYETLQWLMHQMAGVGPMFGQHAHFSFFAKDDVPYAQKRYKDESKRLLGVLETRLKNADYLAGEYSIADMAVFPWLAAMQKKELLSFDSYPAIQGYMDRIAKRDAVQEALEKSEVAAKNHKLKAA